MTTFRRMNLRIAAEINRQDLGPEIRDAITSAIDEYRNEGFTWNEARAAFTTSAGQEYYTVGSNNLPTDIQFVQSMLLTVNGSTYPVTHRNFWEIDELQINDSYQGYPQDWAWHGNAVRFYPTPNSAFAVEVAYVQDVSADAVTSGAGWFTRGERMIRAKAKSLLYLHLDNLFSPQKAAAFSTDAEKEFRRLKGEANNLQASGHIVPRYL